LYDFILEKSQINAEYKISIYQKKNTANYTQSIINYQKRMQSITVINNLLENINLPEKY